uniref:Transposase n=1 Tax=Candidatus Kentrum sp. MB TaxID=2138164 RepID=A0A450XKG8_9GAMM|nr:MAG: Putative transposase [Candidatus Kentron sp. MB]VFK29802.1 MAG: Putative transposase [Candidatus Kentron sp. MB]VFK74950.1 MAG: Putative transposase [Candidatus Kentron sp. MB]
MLHTHSRKLDYHPHVHFVMHAAAIDKEKKQWRTKEEYLFSDRALAKVFRAKMLEAITDEELILPERHPKKWVVHGKFVVGTGDKALILSWSLPLSGQLPDMLILYGNPREKRERMLDHIPELQQPHQGNYRRYSLTVTVLLTSPSPALFAPTIQYSSSTPRSWSAMRAVVFIAISTSAQGPAQPIRRWIR